MNRLGVIKISHEMVDNLEFLTPWKDLDFYVIKNKIQQSPYIIDGFVFLSTCNRIEIIYKIHNPKEHINFFQYMLKELPKTAIQPEHITGRPVITHLLKLCSGLESMVLGETEIRYQVKEAVKKSLEENVLDSSLNQLFQSIFRESKEIRKYIPSNIPLSISSLGVRNLEEKLGGFASHDEYFIVIGSGPISKSCVEYIKKWGGNEVIWVNRTKEKIKEYADRLKVPALSLNEFFDIGYFKKNFPKKICAIVSATSSNEPILKKDFIQSLNSDKLIIVDLAMPSDVEDNVQELKHVQIINLQIIKEHLERNRKRREEAAKNALNILEESLYRVETNWIRSITTPVLKEIQEKIHYHSRKRLESLFEGHLKHLSNKDKRILYDWAIKFHRDMNRIHQIGIEKILYHYYKYKENNKT
ncbi:MAG: hypothetical protein KatS3mg129_2386 [Leptospiraceae bacterium]|nr:MAG: hypothetical protein KatS3mg129_2386 [Leptospiraceae bacterium]